MPMVIDNQRVASTATSHVDIVNPATQEKLSRVPLCTPSELETAVASCKAAFPAWRDTSVSNRARVMFKWQALIREHTDRLARCITEEQATARPAPCTPHAPIVPRSSGRPRHTPG